MQACSAPGAHNAGFPAVPAPIPALAHHAHPTRSLVCQHHRWGPRVDDLGYKTRYRAFLSEQVVDESKPNTLILAHIDVYKPHVSSSEAVSQWQEKSVSPNVHIVKTLYHPGEVNKVRELPQHPELLVTHTDSPNVYVWNIDRQPDRRPPLPTLGGVAAAGKHTRSSAKPASASAPSDPLSFVEPSTPDLVLVGHEADALFPLACCSGRDPRVGSGGNDNLVLVWDLGDHVSSLTAAGSVGAAAGGGAAGAGKGKAAPELKARNRLEGHTATVGDLVFQPGSSQVLMSVADDGRIITWDVRQPGGRVATVEEAHGSGVNVMCVDWSGVDDNLIVTGAQDGGLQVWDRRRMSRRGDRLFAFEAHRNAPGQRDVIHVEWHPTCKNVFASGSEDHTVAIWDISRTPATANASQAAAPAVGSQQAPAGEELHGEAAAGAAAGEEGGADAEAKGPERVTRKRTRGSAAGQEEGGGGKTAVAPAAGGAKGGGKGGAKGGGGAAGGGEADLPPQLIFQHFGHRLGRITDFQWLPSEPWTLISVSDNSAVQDDPDGSLQVWRPLDLIYRPEEEVLQELEQHRQFILRGASSATKDREKEKERETEKGKEKEKDGKEQDKDKAATEADLKTEAAAA